MCCDCGVDMVCAPKSMVSIVMSAHSANVKIEKFDLGNAWFATGERFVKYSPKITFATLKEDYSKFHNSMTETFMEEGKRVEILAIGRSESRIFAEIRPIVDFELIDSIEAMIVEFDAFWKTSIKVSRNIRTQNKELDPSLGSFFFFCTGGVCEAHTIFIER